MLTGGWLPPCLHSEEQHMCLEGGDRPGGE
jgi:hypothetical protein